MTKREALNGKPYAGNPHVRFDEGEAASTCTAAIETEGRNSPSIAQGLSSLRRVSCRRQPEGRTSGCATSRRGSLLYIICAKLMLALSTGIVAASANAAFIYDPANGTLTDGTVTLSATLADENELTVDASGGRFNNDSAPSSGSEKCRGANRSKREMRTSNN